MTLRSAHLGTPLGGSRPRKLLAAAFVTVLAVAVPVSGAQAGKGKPEVPSAQAGTQDVRDKAEAGVAKRLVERQLAT